MEKHEQRLVFFAKIPERSNHTGQSTWAQKDSNLHILVERLLAGHQHTKKISRTNHNFLFVNRIVGWQMISLPSKHWFQINIPGKGSLKRSGRTFQRINVKLQLLLFKPVGGGRQEQDDTFQSWTSWCYLSRPFQKNNRNFCWLTARKEIILTQLSYWLFPHVVWQDKKNPESKN